MAEIVAPEGLELPVAEVVAPEELDALAAGAIATGCVTELVGETLLPVLLVLLVEESLELEPPHAASKQHNAPKALPRTKVFIVRSPSRCKLL